ncbi:MAG: glycerophosphodiester phosphodiesterase [Saprospiraceae bacterium]|nr:glycerophosphodiester phosphodiesterase [Saprospiraceae bacterium]
MEEFDWQGHRGARAALPENTTPAMLFALQFPYIKTLECDVVVSKDSQIIVSHEPFFSHHISTRPDGEPVTEAEAMGFNLFEMTVEEIQKFDVGKRGNEKFPDQKPMAIFKPTLKEMIRTVNEYCEKNDRHGPAYNIEIKSHSDVYDKFVPQPKEFVRLLVKELRELGVLEDCTLQSFDTKILEELNIQVPEATIALLVERTGNIKEDLSTISFKPEIYSPNYYFLTEGIVSEAHSQGIRVIPWTVNELKDLQRMVDIGVDGIITDYVDRPPNIHFKK